MNPPAMAGFFDLLRIDIYARNTRQQQNLCIDVREMPQGIQFLAGMS